MELIPEALVRDDLLRRVLPREHQYEVYKPDQRGRSPGVVQQAQDGEEVVPEDVEVLLLEQVGVDRAEAEVGVNEVEQPSLGQRDVVVENDVRYFFLLLGFIIRGDLVHLVAFDDAVDDDVCWALHHDHELDDLLLGARVPELEDAAHELLGVDLEEGLHHGEDLGFDDVLVLLKGRLEEFAVVVELGELIRDSAVRVELIGDETELPAVYVEFEDRREGENDLLAGFGVLFEGELGGELGCGLGGAQEAEREDGLDGAEDGERGDGLLVVDVVPLLEAEDVLEDGLDANEDGRNFVLGRAVDEIEVVDFLLLLGEGVLLLDDVKVGLQDGLDTLGENLPGQMLG